MLDVLAKKHESLATTKEIMDALRAMFGQQEWSLRHETTKYIYTKRMKKGTSVRERVLDMMIHFNIAEVNGGAINEANQNKGKKAVEKGKCYHCGQNGHWLRNPKVPCKEKGREGNARKIVLEKGFQKARSLSRLEQERWSQLKQWEI
ncbi:gag/pol protein [Cucumis melo var. makuwa]|uniref:Gag/pol protein n=1 Tax=Cucumis melo var. makuwa TaxID=1194695 RepID=A0A5D3DSA2_CUCMM|nr:gag/pol protein [Cucumis melo var. makuwa]